MSEPSPNQPLEQFRPSDAPDLLSLSESIHWPHTLEDWQTALASGIVFGHRDNSGKILSSSGVFCYGDELASLGVVIVRPEARRRGLGRHAVLRSLDQAGARPVILVATPDGEPIYKQLGFMTVESVNNLIASRGVSLHGGLVRTMKDADLPVAIALDREVFGADRRILLENRWKQATAGAILPDRSGFAFRVPQRDRIVIGPIIARDDSDAMELIAMLSQGHSGPVRIDMPAVHAELVARLTAAGFEVRAQRPLMIKTKSEARLPGDRSRLFGFAALAFG
jgi:hypothetical protein